jgi:hypothetical protein
VCACSSSEYFVVDSIEPDLTDHFWGSGSEYGGHIHGSSKWSVSARQNSSSGGLEDEMYTASYEMIRRYPGCKVDQL